ncbi:MAG: NAD(P)H-dependent glycerol-3-phosphate dehydrogenase [Methylococcales bacterium]
MPSITVMGAGSWGTALVNLIATTNPATTLWAHNPEHAEQLKISRRNERYLPGVQFPASLLITSDIREAVEHADIILLVLPSHAFRSVLQSIKPYLTINAKIVWASKGLDKAKSQLLHETVYEVLSKERLVAVLSGPNFAREVAKGLPTATTIASPNDDFAKDLADIIHNDCFRVYTSNDIIGVQIGGAVKNVLAIAAGIADGLGFGANTRAAIITRGLAEMMRLGTKLGGKPVTFMGLAGLGDLVLTCTDNQSRNRRFGLGLGKGLAQTEIIEQIGQEIEGISAAQEVILLADRYEIEMPICEQTYQVIYQNLSPTQAVKNLLARNSTSE